MTEDDDLFSPAVEVIPPRPGALGPVFTATYGGVCEGCHDLIERDDRIRADGYGGWIHEGCEDA